jgi:hypothetical protein
MPMETQHRAPAPAASPEPGRPQQLAPQSLADLRLPERSILIHVGPPKTGTTTLQEAFDRSREATRAQGVLYAGAGRHSATAALAVTQRPAFGRREPPPIRAWHDIVQETRAARDARVVISSELYADATPEAIARIVADLGPDRVHVVATLRPLGKIMPSQWQQWVQNSERQSYEAWLRRILDDGTGPEESLFWRRHRHDELIERWANAVSAERVAVVVVDERDPGTVLRVFEALLGLASQTLTAHEHRANRSLTLGEVEAWRAFNIAFERDGFQDPAFRKAVRFSVGAYMKQRLPGPEEPRVRTPPWAARRIADLERQMVEGIAHQGVRVVGNLEDLLIPQGAATGEPEPKDGASAAVPPEAAAAMAMGMLGVLGLARSPASDAPAPGAGRGDGEATDRAGGELAGGGGSWSVADARLPAVRPLGPLRTGYLVRVVAGRTGSALGRLLRRR